MSTETEKPPLVLLDDERTDTKVRCRICGTWVTFARSRLFFVGDGTVRTCRKGLDAHGKAVR